MNKVVINIIEDDGLIRMSLVDYLSSKKDFSSVSAFLSMEDYLQNVKRAVQSKEIVLLDIQLPGISGIEGISEIKNLNPDADIIMLTTFEESEKIFEALCEGACSYLTKKSTLNNIYECILTVMKGGSYMSPAIARKVATFFQKEKIKDDGLTKRQKEIVAGIVDGLSYKMIAAKLDISLDTVRTHIMQIYRTLNINCKGQLIKWAMDYKI